MQPLRQFDSFKFEAVNDNDKFKIEMRKIESKMESNTKTLQDDFKTRKDTT